MNSYQLLLPTAALYICSNSPSILQQGRAGNISPNVSVILSCETPGFDFRYGFKNIRIKLAGGDTDKKGAKIVTVLKPLNITILMLIKRSNLMQQCADIYLLQSHSTWFGCHSTHYQEH